MYESISENFENKIVHSSYGFFDSATAKSRDECSPQAYQVVVIVVVLQPTAEPVHEFTSSCGIMVFFHFLK